MWVPSASSLLQVRGGVLWQLHCCLRNYDGWATSLSGLRPSHRHGRVIFIGEHIKCTGTDTSVVVRLHFRKRLFLVHTLVLRFQMHRSKCKANRRWRARIPIAAGNQRTHHPSTPHAPSPLPCLALSQSVRTVVPSGIIHHDASQLSV